MNQVITASMPVLTCAFAICIEKNYWPNNWQILGIIPICVGVMISVYEEAHNETLGVALCACATVANALRTALSSHLLSGKLDVFSMTWYTGPVAAVVLLPVALYREFSAVSEYAVTNMGPTVGILLGGSMLALTYNIVLFLTIKTLSGVTMNVMGNIKIIFLLLMSRVVLGELAEVDVRLASGVVLTFGGFFLYSYGTFQKMKSPPAPSKAAVAEDGNVEISLDFRAPLLPSKIDMR
eukprot:CAMPEP_0198214392 /NCGR_PEP_ID=MMETSP1445-20131203/41112_1 /TAXON_ID=36898 /ORGANISM="Pyramimonas sp., Strain CCMP2087" /LENGTH=237 /DNA_ID=CAMNT_0043889579 /DNA_START=612 /DNA_END=1325 /DNA_ORIENTATION=-